MERAIVAVGVLVAVGVAVLVAVGVGVLVAVTVGLSVRLAVFVGTIKATATVLVGMTATVGSVDSLPRLAKIINPPTTSTLRASRPNAMLKGTWLLFDACGTVRDAGGCCLGIVCDGGDAGGGGTIP